MTAVDGFDVLEADILARDERETVYRGYERAGAREVEIHVIRDAGADPGFSRKFQEEAELLRSSESRDIVPLRGAGAWQGGLYYATEPVRGGFLASARASGFRFTSEEIFQIAEGVARALRATQPCRMLHCDVRPESILLGSDGAVKVARFVLRRASDRAADQEASASLWRYASPEEGKGQSGDIRSDIYALGTILYELASGKSPFEGHDSATSFLYQLVHADPPPPREQGALILPELERLILRCLAKDPQDRYGDPDELLLEVKTVKDSIGRARGTGGAEDRLGDFEVYQDQFLGEGGMGTLYRGQQRLLRRPVAIKVMREQCAADPQFVLRFRREAELLAQLNHPNVVQVFGTGTWRGRHFYAMELLEGKDAATLIKEQGRLDAREALRICEEVAKALCAMWKYRIVHRDIKPSNILITPAGEVKVSDFGLAKSLRVPKAESRLIAGTSEYVSPEQGLGNTVDIRSDIYSLGVVLYEFLAGRPPFQSTGSFTKVIDQHAHIEPPPLEKAAGPLPGPLLNLVRRCLAKRPQERYQTPEELLAELSRIQRSLGVMPSAPMPAHGRPAGRGLGGTWQRVKRAVGKISGRLRRVP